MGKTALVQAFLEELVSSNAALVLFPALWAASITKGADTLFRYSVNDATTQILYLPVPSQARVAAKAFIDFLFSPQAQSLWAQAGFRPVIPEVIAQTTALFPGQIDKLWTIAELGKVLGEGTAAENDGKDLTGWKAIDTALFGSKGAVTKIYNAGGRK